MKEISLDKPLSDTLRESPEIPINYDLVCADENNNKIV